MKRLACVIMISLLALAPAGCLFQAPEPDLPGDLPPVDDRTGDSPDTISEMFNNSALGRDSSYYPDAMQRPQPLVDVASPSFSGRHPFLMFDEIGEVPGYRHRSASPWSGWEDSVLDEANAALKKDFSDPTWGGGSDNYVASRGLFAMHLGLAYQITGNAKYSNKAKEALLNIGVGEVPKDPGFMTPEGIRAISLLGYCLAYDWAQPALDARSDAIVRDRLAQLADKCFSEAKGSSSIDFVDWMGQSYPILGIAGVTLFDYASPGGAQLSSGPADWRRAGTDYLFVKDDLHDLDRPLIDYEVDGEGKDLLGAYKIYYIDDLAWWAQVYTRYYGNNFLETYPLAKKIFTSEVWESLPNYYSNNFITNGNIKYDYHRGIANLLDPVTRSWALNHEEQIRASRVLPYTRTISHIFCDGQLPSALLYLVYDDYSSLPKASPSYTSHLSPDSVYQVFREGWAEDSDWLAMVTFVDSVPASSYRNMQHHDQLGFEYYAKGDLLLADAGEDRQTTDKYKGEYEVHHNTIAIENPRSPFAAAKWSGSPARGMYKGDEYGLATPVSIDCILRAPWMEMVSAEATIGKLIGSSHNSLDLSSPIQYERQVLYPEKDYFIVIDRMQGVEEWAFRNLFRPASLSISPSSSSKKIGHVKGSLSIGGKSYDWLSLAPKKDYATGITANAFEWSTTSPYGSGVELQVYTVPASDTYVMKHIGRVGGYDEENEVYSPVVYFKSGPARELYRATVLLPRYTTESARTPATISVNGNGNALKVASSGYEDYVYTGRGTSSFDSFSTDAETAFIRKATGGPLEYTIVEGSRLYDGDALLVSASEPVDYLTSKRGADNTWLKVGSSSAVKISLPANGSYAYRVKMDGELYGGWTLRDDGTLSITAGPGEHDFEVARGSKGTPSPAPAKSGSLLPGAAIVLLVPAVKRACSIVAGAG